MAVELETNNVGTVKSLWRYPVKSMQGEALTEALVTERGVLGDRAYAVMDRATGHIASAKHPRKWRALFACSATFAMPPQVNQPLTPVVITLPNGDVVSSAQPDIDQILSRVLGRDVTLLAEAPPVPTREANRSPIDSFEETIMQEPMALAAPGGTFFDYAPIHVLTTATLRQLESFYPTGCFAVRRFRPNIVVAPPEDEHGFVENAWIGHPLTVGSIVRMQIIDPSPRCLVPTLAQGDLPHDPGILRTVSHYNSAASATLAPGVVFPAVAGVYARSTIEGMIRCGDVLRLKRNETEH